MRPNREWEAAHAASKAPQNGSIFQAERHWREKAEAQAAELSALRARVSELEAEIGKLREERDACQSEMAKARRLKQDAESRRDVEIVVNHELRDALREAEALIARNVYPTPDKPNSDWAVLHRVRAALSPSPPEE
jgi:predicted RNase H-like nuclease (RuvC/YqgF family)